MNDRILGLRNKMAGLNIQGMIISNPINVKYLTGIEAEGILLITRKENVYITDSRYIEYVSNTITPFDEIVVDDFKNISKDDYENFFLFCENVGFEENFVTYADYKRYMHTYKINNFVEASCLMEKLRIIKDSEEINSIKQACKITDDCFEILLEYIKPGMTEKDIAKKIENYYREHSDGVSFEPIVASGENSSKPHAVPTERKINENDIITIDMGCKINGYCSDMTRTIFLGTPTDEQKYVYDLVLKNQIKSLNEMKDGASIKDISKIVTSNFALEGYDMAHGLGHGVGLDIHEPPFIKEANDNTLKEKMVVTDEPGIYIPGNFGIRIEDTILITKEGPEVLTKSKKEM
jgi:Xaa-Pro aminopeptidase